MKLRDKLVLSFLLIAVAGPTMVGGVLIAALIRQAQKRSGERLQDSVAQAATTIDQFMVNCGRDLKSFITDHDIIEEIFMPELMRLEVFVHDHPHFQQALFTDEKGTILASSYENRVGQSIFDHFDNLRDEFEQATGAPAGTIYISDMPDITDAQRKAAIAGNLTDTNLHIQLLTALRDSSGRLSGVVLVDMAPDPVRAILEEVARRSPANTAVHLLDRAGRILMSADPTVPLLQPSLDLESARTRAMLADGGNHYLVHTNARARRVMTGFSSLASYGENRVGQWRLVATVPYSVIMRPATAALKGTLAILFAIIAVSAAAGVWMGRRMARPIAALTRAATGIAGGEYSARVNVIEKDETGTLATAFNGMAETIDRQLVELREGRDLLDQRVKERTAELANELAAREIAEAALRESEEQIRGAFRAGAIGMALARLDGRFMRVNRSLCEMLGYTEAELLSLKFVEITHPDDRAMTVDFARRLTAGEIPSYQIEKRYLHKDGHGLWVRLSVSLVRDAAGAPLHFVGQMENIMERKKAEEDLTRLAAAIDQVIEAIMITDTKGVIQYVNPAFERITGFSSEEAIGKTPRILKSGQHDDAYYTELWQTISAGGVWQGELKNRRKDGKLYDEYSIISPVRDSKGTIINYVAIKRDITQEVNLERQLRQAQKMEAVGQLAGGVAHDFNNLLQVIMGYGMMLERSLPRDSGQFEDLTQIQEAGKRASELTRQLLAFSRQQVMQPRIVDLNELIGHLLKMLRRLIGANINLHFASASEVGQILADPGQIEQVLTNLCVNARDAMPEGGELKIETSDVRLNEDYCREHPWAKPGRYALISVTDSGCGMEQEVLQKIFEPFFTTKDVGRGTGLGLATAYGIIRQHHGLIHVYSEVGSGTTFRIYLPVSDARGDAAQEAAARPVRGGTETILVAEDDESLRRMVTRVLGEAGYTVLAAANGVEALKMYEENREQIAMALVDVVMPEMGGRKLHDVMKTIDPCVRILFSSGYAPDITHLQFVMDNGLKLIQKPYDTDDLLRRVREVLDAE